MIKIIVVSLVFVLLASCSRPGPTTMSFSETDILGTWTHSDTVAATQSSSEPYTVAVTLKADGTFTQVIEGESGAGTNSSGTWVLDGSHIKLKDLQSEDWDEATNSGKWTFKDAEWWFVDWHDKDQKVALFGGLHPDPDSFAPWTKQ